MIVVCHQRLIKKAAILLLMAKGSGFLLISIKPLIAILLLIVFCLSSPLTAQANGPIPFTENFDSFTGDGFSPIPVAGQLDSTIWIVNGLSDGNMTFGDTQIADDFARGIDADGVTTGGIYAFDTGGGNIMLGIQPGGEDFTPGNITLRLQNNTGNTITQLDIAYDIWHLNDQDRANSLNFSYSPDNIFYTPIPALNFTTPDLADGLSWQTEHRAATLTGLNIANGASFYLQWTGDDVSGGGSRDEYGIDNVQISPPTGDTPPTVTATFPSNNATNIPIEVNITLDFSENVTVTGQWFNITCTSSGDHLANADPGPQQYTLDPNDDFAPDETCTVTIFASQITDQDGTPDSMNQDFIFNFSTTQPVSGWIINEIHADPDATNGDANGDGIVDTSQDEFVEIINSTGGLVDISGWTLNDNTGPRHIFPPGMLIPDQCAIVIFGGGTPTGTFGSAIVQTAGTLGLNNTGDSITLNDGTSDQTTYTFGGEGGNNQSLTRDPDITGPEPLVLHSTATGSGGRLYSPGTKIDGTPFGSCIPPDLPPTVVTTIPGDTAIGVLPNASITIQFNEIVNITDAAFNMECPTGMPIPLTINPAPPGNAADFLLIPAQPLPYNTTCSVSISAAEVTDQDGLPDQMTSDYFFTFSTTTPPDLILISEFLYDGLTPTTEGDEFVEICNPNPYDVDLAGYKIGDEEIRDGGESMVEIPAGTMLASNACITIAKNATDFFNRFSQWPNFEVVDSDLAIPNLDKYPNWSNGTWSLANTGDELLILGPNDEIIDSVAYRNGDYATLGLEPDASAPEPHSLQRIWPLDTDSMPDDFVRTTPNPGFPTIPPPPPSVPPPAAHLPGGMNAYWGDLHAHTSYSDGAGPPHYALAMARAVGLHFFAVTDHGAWLSLYEWDRTLIQTNQAGIPDEFVALRGVEWTHPTDGHINVFNSNTLLSRDDPQFDTLPEIYDWLATNPNTIAQFNHPGTNYDGGFDNFPFNAATAPSVHLQEIGNNGNGYVTYESAFIQSNTAGWMVAPANNSDIHSANWGLDSATRTGIVAPALTETDLLAALRARRVFATEDGNFALTLRLNDAWMGSVLTSTGALSLTVDFVDADSEPLTLFVYDGNLLLTQIPFENSTGQWATTINALPGHFFWVKAIQADGDTAYSAPVWIEGQALPDTLTINEILPAPYNHDWDGNGTSDHLDEWIEIYNPLDRPVGLGGWRLTDSSSIVYDIPLGTIIPARGFATFYRAQTNFSLNNAGDTVSLIHPNGTTVDTFSYAHSPGYDETWCRLPDGDTHWSDNCGPSPNARNWELAAPGPLKVSIFDAKHLTPGAWVQIKGRVTAPPDLLANRTMYIQDETAGIMIYLPKDHRYCDLGSKVELQGNLKIYHGEFEIAVSERGDIKCTEPGTPPPPLPIATGSLLEPYEGMLVMLQGPAVEFQGRVTLWLDDNTGWAKVYIRQRTGIQKPFIEMGTPMAVVGIVSQYSDSNENASREDYRLLPRYQEDLILPTLPPVDWPLFLPETGY